MYLMCTYFFSAAGSQGQQMELSDGADVCCLLFCYNNKCFIIMVG